MRRDPHARGIFWVASQSDPSMEHMVDITENAPLGGCGCPHHQMRAIPQYRKTGTINRCAHLKAVAEFIFNEAQEKAK